MQLNHIGPLEGAYLASTHKRVYPDSKVVGRVYSGCLLFYKKNIFIHSNTIFSRPFEDVKRLLLNEKPQKSLQLWKILNEPTKEPLWAILNNNHFAQPEDTT